MYAPVQEYRNSLVGRIEKLEADLEFLTTASATWEVDRVFLATDDSSQRLRRLFRQKTTLEFVDDAVLEMAAELARFDVHQAYELLFSAIQEGLTSQVKQLGWNLQAAEFFLSRRLEAAGTCRMARTVVYMQRRWFLMHGSHQIESTQSVA
jgi:hypothetical protein